MMHPALCMILVVLGVMSASIGGALTTESPVSGELLIWSGTVVARGQFSGGRPHDLVNSSPMVTETDAAGLRGDSGFRTLDSPSASVVQTSVYYAKSSCPSGCVVIKSKEKVIKCLCVGQGDGGPLGVVILSPEQGNCGESDDNDKSKKK